MSVTDELRRLLDERGVEYETDERNAITEWSTYYGAFVFFARQREGKLLVETTVATKHSVILTPEQAIAATLGSKKWCNIQKDYNEFKRCFHGHAIADELNAALSGGECENTNERFNAWTCSECKATLLLMFDDYGEPTYSVDGVADVPRFCPNCGAKVVKR